MDKFGGVSGRDGSIREVGKTLCVGCCGGGQTRIALLLMLIPSRSSAHTVHRKQEEEELFCAKVGERTSKTSRKGSNPIVFQKYTANLRDSDSYQNRLRIGKL